MLVHGYVRSRGDDRLVVGCYLYDVALQDELVREGWVVRPADWRRAAHKCSDIIYARLTGEDPFFDSRIAYIAETGPKDNRVKRLAVMDSDGANHRFLTDGSDLVLTPRFNPEGTSIAYMAYRGQVPQIYERNLLTDTERPFGNFPGMTFAPKFSPNGELLAMSLASNGNTDLYLLDLENGRSPDQREI